MTRVQVEHLWVEADDVLALIREGWYPDDDADRSARDIADALAGETMADGGWREEFVNGIPDGEPEALRTKVRGALKSARGIRGGTVCDIHWLHELIDRHTERAEAFMRGEERTAAADTRGARRPASKGRPTLGQIVESWEGDDRLNLSVGFNELQGAAYVTGPTPWDAAGERRRFSDTDAANLLMVTQEAHPRATKGDVSDALKVFVARRPFNPLTTELRRLARAQRGLNYAPHLLARLVGADDGRYEQQVMLAWMRMSVARAFRPGIVGPWMPVIYGPQGCGKSLFCSRMAMRAEWFSDSLGDLSDIQRTSEAMQGRWICELGELSAMRGRDIESVKATITRTCDVYREPWGTFAAEHPRRSVFVGTTNAHGFLRDRTGNRRFVPLTVGVARPEYDMRDEGTVAPIIREAWGEVVAEYLKASSEAGTEDEFLRLFPVEPPADVIEMAERERGDFREADDNGEAVADWLSKRQGGPVCAAEAAKEALGVEQSDYSKNRRLQHEVTEIMDSMRGWHRVSGKRRCGTYGSRTCWERDTEAN